MIHYLSGTILDLQQNIYLVVTNNIGFEIAVPHSYTALPGTEITLFVYPHLTQDNYQLFGFKTSLEKRWFKKLLNISGVGPKTALQVVSKEIASLERAIVSQDQHFFESVSGIGKKTALKILIELSGDTPFPSEKLQGNSPYHQAVQTLRGLGYEEIDIQKMTEALPKNLTAGQIVTLALKNHAQKSTH